MTTALPPLAAPAPVLGFLLVHAALRRDVEELARAAHAGQPLAERVRLLDRVVRAHHHGEDHVLLPLLRSKEPSVRDIADAVEAQHVGLDDAFDGLRARIADGAPVVDEVDALSVALEDHLVLEETQLLPVWWASLSDREHERFARRLRRATPWRDIAVMVPWLIDAVPQPMRHEAESELPKPVRFAYRHGMRQRFERRWRIPGAAPVPVPSA